MSMLACLSCKKQVAVEDNTRDIKALRTQSNYVPIIMIDTRHEWLCPGCAARVADLVRQLMVLLPDEDIFWDGLRHLAKPPAPPA